MALTYTLIASSVVGSGGASSIDFTSIPATYTDLLLVASTKNTNGTLEVTYVSFNNSSANFTGRYLQGNGSATSSGSLARYAGLDSAGTSTFSNWSMYIPNYAGSNNKSFSADAVSENNATAATQSMNAGLWSQTTAINQITIFDGSGTNFVQYSTAYLYGIKNS